MKRVIKLNESGLRKIIREALTTMQPTAPSMSSAQVIREIDKIVDDLYVRLERAAGPEGETSYYFRSEESPAAEGIRAQAASRMRGLLEPLVAGVLGGELVDFGVEVGQGQDWTVRIDYTEEGEELSAVFHDPMRVVEFVYG
jgi:hypothetical protein